MDIFGMALVIKEKSFEYWPIMVLLGGNVTYN